MIKLNEDNFVLEVNKARSAIIDNEGGEYFEIVLECNDSAFNILGSFKDLAFPFKMFKDNDPNFSSFPWQGITICKVQNNSQLLNLYSKSNHDFVVSFKI